MVHTDYMSLSRVRFFVCMMLLFLALGVFVPVEAKDVSVSPVKSTWSLHDLPTYRIQGPIDDMWHTQLTNQDTGTSLKHKVVYDTARSRTLLYVKPEQTPAAGTYVFSIASSSDQPPFFTDSFMWTMPGTIDGDYRITRSTLPTIIQPDTTYHERITVHASHTIEGSLVEKIPFESVPTATEASIIKRPELLNLHKPFDGDYPVSLEFGHVNPVDHLGMPYHDGTDYAVPVGTIIRAVDDGEVIPYREVNSYGTTVAIQHTWGRSYYGHLSSSSALLGAHVKKGDPVGISGNTGLSTGPHLHFAMVWGDEQLIDPDPHVTRVSPQPTSQKELVWPLSLKAGESQTFEYTFVLPAQDDTAIATNTLGPASIVDQYEACRPPFVSQALLTHYEKNDEQATGDTEDQTIAVCPVITKEKEAVTVLSSATFGQNETDKQPAPQVAGISTTNSGIQTKEPDASNITPTPAFTLPDYPTTYLENTRFWYNPTTSSIEGIDDVTGESWSQLVGKKKEIDLVLDMSTYRVRVLSDNTLSLAKKQ